MGIVGKVSPPSVNRVVVRGVEAVVPERYRHHIPDAITGLGVVATASGVLKGGKAGALLRIGGQFCDDLDGSAAGEWGLMNKAGKFKDAVSDKIKTVLEVGASWYAANTLPEDERFTRRAVIGGIALKHTVNAALCTATERWGGDSTPHISGRANMWFDGLTFGFLASADQTDRAAHPRFHDTQVAIGYSAAALGAVTGVVSATVYAGRTIDAYRHRNDLPEEDVVVYNSSSLSAAEPDEIGLAALDAMPDTL